MYICIYVYMYVIVEYTPKPHSGYSNLYCSQRIYLYFSQAAGPASAGSILPRVNERASRLLQGPRVFWVQGACEHRHPCRGSPKTSVNSDSPRAWIHFVEESGLRVFGVSGLGGFSSSGILWPSLVHWAAVWLVEEIYSGLSWQERPCQSAAVCINTYQYPIQ